MVSKTIQLIHCFSIPNDHLFIYRAGCNQRPILGECDCWDRPRMALQNAQLLSFDRVPNSGCFIAASWYQPIPARLVWQRCHGALVSLKWLILWIISYIPNDYAFVIACRSEVLSVRRKSAGRNLLFMACQYVNLIVVLGIVTSYFIVEAACYYESFVERKSCKQRLAMGINQAQLLTSNICPSCKP